MLLQDCNPYIRMAQIQPAILERTGLRKAYEYRIFYIMENEGFIQIEDESYPIRQDSVIILPPNTPYDFRGRLKVAVLNFDITRRFAHQTQPLFPPSVAEFVPSLMMETELLDGFDRPIVLHTNGSLQNDILKIVFHFNSHRKCADASASAQLKLLFAELSDANEDPKDKQAEKILTHIRMHAASIGCNEDVARTFGYHPVYLNELIKRCTGKTLHSVIVEAKLQIACQYLTKTTETIETISALAGFCSRAYFCVLFKKKFGLSPAQYRKHQAKQT